MWFKYEDFDNLEQAIKTYKYYLGVDYMSDSEFDKIDNIVDIEFAINDITQQLNESFYDIELKDDDRVSTGGIAFLGETIGNFIEEISGDKNITINNLKELNKELIACGILPIMVIKSDMDVAKKVNETIQNELGLFTTTDLEDIIVSLVAYHECTSSDSINNLIYHLERLRDNL